MCSLPVSTSWMLALEAPSYLASSSFVHPLFIVLFSCIYVMYVCIMYLGGVGGVYAHGTVHMKRSEENFWDSITCGLKDIKFGQSDLAESKTPH